MAQLLSDYLGVGARELTKRGVLDSVLGVDTHLFVDPHLLRRTRIPELKQSRRRIERYFLDILRLLRASQRKGDAAWRAARQRLIFPELHGASIGYGTMTSDGNAIGPVLGNRLLETAAELVALGVRDPEIFELIGLFEEGFGADRLSDMTLAIVRDELFAFSARITRQLGLTNVIPVRTPSGIHRLPRHPDGRHHIVFLPTELLRDLPVALTWDDIDRVVATNRELRARLNALIGSVWKRGQRIPKRALRQLVLGNVDAVRSLVQAYKTSTKSSYDLERDGAGLVSWYADGQSSATANPITLTLPPTATVADLELVVEQIVAQFKRNIEVNGLNEHLYESDAVGQRPRHERYSQRLFYSVADTYCRANNLDISREPNAGAGPVDFKISSGYERKVLVEVKLSSNKALLHGFEKQLPTYEESEATQRSVYVIIRVTASTAGTKRVQRLKVKLDKEGKRSPTLIVIDGTVRPAASRRR